MAGDHDAKNELEITDARLFRNFLPPVIGADTVLDSLAGHLRKSRVLAFPDRRFERASASPLRGIRYGAYVNAALKLLLHTVTARRAPWRARPMRDQSRIWLIAEPRSRLISWGLGHKARQIGSSKPDVLRLDSVEVMGQPERLGDLTIFSKCGHIIGLDRIPQLHLGDRPARCQPPPIAAPETVAADRRLSPRRSPCQGGRTSSGRPCPFAASCGQFA